ncbi:MAG: hypothetical protein P4L10_06675 [Acidobacteriaceae bacterium]|nr:hypothetical protein [Acidobacteriaceae bacterium]
MTIDLKTIESNLAKAKLDVLFWEKARAVFSDPRVAAVVGSAELVQPRPTLLEQVTAQKPYGELKRRVYALLPGFEDDGLTTSAIVGMMQNAGYIFASKYPPISVNEALVTLAGEGKARIVGKRGVSNLWTREKVQSQLEENAAG